MARVVLTLSQKLQNYLTNKNSREEKVTGPVIQLSNKILDYISARSMEIFENNIKMETKLAGRENYNLILEELAQKIVVHPLMSIDEVMQEPVVQRAERREEFPVIISLKNSEEDVDVIKKNIREICKTEENLPIPRDVIVKRDKRVILKMKNRRETEKIREKLINDENLKE